MPARVVVVHDDPDFVDELATAVRSDGHDVATFADPLAAWDALEAAQRIEVLVTRVQFPPGKPHGFALARMARSKRPTIRVLFVALPEFADDAAELGEFMPITSGLQDVVNTVRRMLDQGEENAYRPSRAD
jgi:DNA-binding NtrC family response regulator